MTNTPQRGDNASISGSSDDEAILDLANDEGWEDLEPDVEAVNIVCLMCSAVFNDVKPLLNHCRDAHNVDIGQLVKDLHLDFLDTIKLVNYIRGETKAGIQPLELSEKTVFEDEKYLQPVLEDDALLYSLHDAFGELFEDDNDDVRINAHDTLSKGTPSTDLIAQDTLANGQRDTASADGLDPEALEQYDSFTDEPYPRDQEVQHLKARIKAHEASIASLKGIVEEMDRPLTSDEMGLGVTPSQHKAASDAIDLSYFASYSGHDIHETMLKDTVRTDAYRDFIYENKHLFEGKTVLDVGCGTGILSMFCARAGAAKVIAVDNSDIINSARENIYTNGMGETITCLRGKIEEVVLPVRNVDIIVSEWMGYCLLYEAMLDSVIWARDCYLKPDGLMVPSHCTLRIAPMSDPEYIDEHVNHWKNVYGFDMSSMCHNIYDDTMIQQVPTKAIAGDSSPFMVLPLKTISTEDLSFGGREFKFQIRQDTESLDGFVIWFDTFFSKSSNTEISAHLRAEDCSHNDKVANAFTTGPFGKDTHWHQGVLLINHHGKQPNALQKGQIISGTTGYEKRRIDSRALDISVHWELERQGTKGKQSWSIR